MIIKCGICGYYVAKIYKLQNTVIIFRCYDHRPNTQWVEISKEEYLTSQVLES